MIKNVIVQSRQAVKNCFELGDFRPLFNSLQSRPFALLSIVGHTHESIGKDKPVENWLFNNLSVDFFKLADAGCGRMDMICFGDVTEQHDWKPDIFTVEQANQVIGFLKTTHEHFPELEDLIVHCDAGISRSGAVGVFACRLFGLDENIVRNARPIAPNPHVLGLLMEQSGLNDQYMSVFDSIPVEKNSVKKSCKEIAKMVMERTRIESKGNWMQKNLLGSLESELESIWPELIEFFKKNKQLLS